MTIHQAKMGVYLFCYDAEFTGYFEQNFVYLKLLEHHGRSLHKRLDWILNQHHVSSAMAMVLFPIMEWLCFDDITFDLLVFGMKEEKFENNFLLGVKVDDMFNMASQWFASSEKPRWN